MTSLFVAATKCRATRKTLKITKGLTIVKRDIIHVGNYDAVIINSVSRSRCLVKNAKIETLRNCRCFSVSSLGRSSTTLKANVDRENVLSSPFPDVHGYTGIYLHEFIYKDLDKWPDKTAAICSATGRRHTFAQLRKLSGRLATSLRKCKLRPGETIAVVLPNIPEYGALFLAASEAGLRVSPVNHAYTAHEIRVQIENSDASAVVTIPSKHALVAASILDNPKVKVPIIILNDGDGVAPPGTIKFEDLVRDDIEEFEKSGEKTGLDPEDTLLLPYSSGTSGLPKGVELTHRNIIANITQVVSKGIAILKPCTETHQEILPLILPMYHSYGMSVCLTSVLTGTKIVTMPKFSADNLFKVLEDHRATVLYAAPPLVQLLANDERLSHRHLDAMKHVVSGAAPIAKDVLIKFKSRAPKTMKMVQGYGLTETTPVISISVDAPIESTGYLVPNTQVRIVGYDEGNRQKNLGFNEVGEIYVRGPQVMKGYLNNPQATADCMEGEWFKTGDLGSYNENGLLFIRGRLKELIKVQGYQVAPAELEHLIQAHAKVADAAVIGVPHEKYGEVPKAFVVPKSNAKLEASEIKDYIAERVSKYKQLGHVEFIDEIPKSAAGKILRRELQKM